MMSKREAIVMSDAEITDFLGEQRTVVVATLGPQRRPHLVPLWFVAAGTTVETWTYGKSQKVLNLGRDPRATLLVESGDTYDQLRGVSMECDALVDDSFDEVVRIGRAMAERYSGGALGDAAVAAVEKQAAKRVLLRFTPTHIVSWDHRKLGGRY